MYPQVLAQTLQQPIPQTIYIVRHGDTKFNSDGTGERVRGWSNVPLTAQGQKEALQAAQKLKGKPIAGMVSSDLVRAQQTAAIISKVIGIKPELDPKLRTWNVGMYGGGKSADVQQEIDWFVEHPDLPIPEGESFNQFKNRVFGAVQAVVMSFFGKIALIVTHHSVERVLEAWDANGQPGDHSINMEVYHEKGDKPGGMKVLRTSVAALRGGNG